MDPKDLIGRIGNGRMLEDLAAALAAVADEVVQTGKKGRVTLALVISTREAGDPMVVVSEEIKRVPPTRAPRGTFLFSHRGQLSTTDPTQVPLPFRDVDLETGEIRTASPVEYEIRGE